jgi:ABC-type nitrate/sulfonate/bicarbonate transport system permease component
VLPWLTVVGLTAALELVVRGGLVPGDRFPSPTVTLASLTSELARGRLWSAMGETLQGWAWGLGIAGVLAIPVGLLVGSSPLCYRSVRVLIEFLRPIPSVALLPVAIILFGNGLGGKAFLAAFSSFWVLLVHTHHGVRAVDPIVMDAARVFRCGRLVRIVHLRLPSAAPFVATGVRVASTVALIVAVSAELVTGAPGLGHDINVARQGGNVEQLYALVVASGCLGWVLNRSLTRVERRVLRWHPSQLRIAAERVR